MPQRELQASVSTSRASQWWGNFVYMWGGMGVRCLRESGIPSGCQQVHLSWRGAGWFDKSPMCVP